MMLFPVVRDIGNLSWLSRKGENEVASSRDASPSEGQGEASMTGRAGNLVGGWPIRGGGRGLRLCLRLRIAGVLLPRSVQVERLVMEREDATCLLEVRIRVASVVREELVFEVSEANHVVAAPVFVHKLAAALLVDVL